MEITYELIEPLIIRTDIKGSRMLCEFQVPESDDTVESSASIRRENTVKSQASRIIKRNLTNQLRRSASRALRSALGGGMLGRTGTTIFNSVTREQARDFMQSFTDEEKQAAILEAFSKVSEYFHFDEQEYMWVKPIGGGMGDHSRKKKPEFLSEFELQLKNHPVSDPFEQEVLARLLVEVAAADGSISEDEKEFLQRMIPANFGTIDEIMVMDPLSDVECEEVSLKVRETIYMLAWVISLLDMELDVRERDLLMQYGDIFGFDTNTKMKVIMAAKHYALENVITPSVSREELFANADKIQLSQREAEKCLINMKRRNG